MKKRITMIKRTHEPNSQKMSLSGEATRDHWHILYGTIYNPSYAKQLVEYVCKSKRQYKHSSPLPILKRRWRDRSRWLDNHLKMSGCTGDTLPLAMRHSFS